MCMMPMMMAADRYQAVPRGIRTGPRLRLESRLRLRASGEVITTRLLRVARALAQDTPSHAAEVAREVAKEWVAAKERIATHDAKARHAESG